MNKACDVLIADDDRLVTGIVKEWVEETGRSAHAVENGFQALRLLQSRPEICLLVTDIRLPVMDGNELIREAIKLRPDLKVVIMTGYPDRIEAPDKFEIIEKPFTSDNLSQALARVCQDLN